MLDLRVHTHTHSHTLTLMHTRPGTFTHAHACAHSPHSLTHVRTLSHSHAHVCTQTLTHLCTHMQFHTCVCSCRCTPPAQSHTCRSTRDDPCCWSQRLYSCESRPPLLVTVPELSSVLSHEGREEAALGDFKGPFPSRLLNSAGPRLNRLHYEIT